jgi:pyruvate dehydrogenase E2 component (dihydrolipoamide acetyltransferase)
MGDIYTVNLPDIGEGVVEGEVIEWLKKVGDPVRQNEPVVMVMTDKATVELPAPFPGILAKQYYQPGEIAIKDKPLYAIELAVGQKATETPKEQAPIVAEPQRQAAITPPKQLPGLEVVKTVPEGQKALAIPSVRKLAKDMGIDLNQIQGTGKGGQVTVEDLKQYREKICLGARTPVEPLSPIPRLPGDEERPVLGIRHLMAKKMEEAKAMIPHFSYFEQVDATRLVQMRQNIKEKALKEGIHLTYMPFFLRTLSLTIKQYPVLNSSFDSSKNTLILHKSHNIGIAIATTLGLIVPVLKNVQEMTLQELIRAYESLKNKALTNKLNPKDMKEATITVSNFGVLGGGGLWAAPIINYPEVAILAMAKIQKQPIVKNDMIVIRDMLHLSWSFDHRVIDGEMAATCSHYYSTLIRDPALLL